MQQGLTLLELAQKLTAEKTQKKDFIINTEHTRLVPMGHGEVDMLLEHRDPDNRNSHFSGQLQPLAHSQTAEQLQIPIKYYNRMRQDAPHLLAENVNTWFRQKPQLRMLRTIGGVGRANLSNRYARIENDVIAEVALQALERHGVDAGHIVSSNVTDSRLYMEVTIPGLEREVKGSPKVGDIVRGGVLITNSEVGLGRVNVSEFYYRLVCTNGMVAQSLLKKTHLGQAILDDESLLADDTKRAMDDAIVLQLRDAIGAALDIERFNQRIDRMSKLTRLRIDGNPNDSVEMLTEVLGPSVGLTLGEQGSILASLVQQGDGATAFGLMQAVTDQANTCKDYDRAIELQQAGGKLLDLPRSEWKRILEVAD